MCSIGVVLWWGPTGIKVKCKIVIVKIMLCHCCHKNLLFHSTVRHLFVFYLTLYILHSNQEFTKVSKNQLNQNTLLKVFYRTLLCRWFRFAQLAKGKKFRP